MARRPAWRARLIAGIAMCLLAPLVAVAAAVGTATDAYASTCDDLNVTTEAALEAALSCHFALTTVQTTTVRLDGPISITGGGLGLTVNGLADGTVIIDGNGHTLTGDPTVGSQSLIHRGGRLEIENLDFTSSNAQGIASLGTSTSLTIRNSTFSNHGSTAVSVQGPIGVIENSTFAGNRTGVNVTSGASAVLRHVTIVDSTLNGIKNFGGAFTVENSLIARSTSVDCAITTGTNTVTGSIVEGGCGAGTPANPGAATGLGVLAANPCAVAVPCTPTVSIGAANAAVDHVGTCATITLDQRGESRPATNCDAGAYEAAADAPGAVDDTLTIDENSPATPIDVLANDVGPNLSVTSVANLTAGAGSVSVDAGGTGVTYTPANGFSGTAEFDYTITNPAGTDDGHVVVTVEPVCSRTITTFAQLQTAVTCHDGEPAGAITRITLGADITIDNFGLGVSIRNDDGGATFHLDGAGFTLTGDAAAGSQSLLLREGNLIIERLNFVNSGASGLISLADAGTVTIRNSTFSGHASSAFASQSTQTATVQNVTMSGNGIGLTTSTGATIDATHVTIVDGNQGLRAFGGTINLDASLLARNSGGHCSTAIGGAINLTANTATDETTNTSNCIGATNNPATATNLGTLTANPCATFVTCTPTASLGAGNAAIAIVPTCPLIRDQRGEIRPATDCDAGAYELGSAAPIAVDDATTIDEDDPAEAIDVLANDLGEAGTISAVSAVNPADLGTVTIDPDSLGVTFTPAADASGVATFDYTTTNGAGSDTGQVTVTVLAQPDTPIGVDDTGVIVEGATTTYDVLANDTDADGDALTITSAFTSPVSSGSVQIVGNQLEVTSFSGQTDPFVVIYAIQDPSLRGVGGIRLDLTVDDVNDPPDAVDDNLGVVEDIETSFSPLTNDTDPENNDLTIQSVTQPATGGSVAIDDDRIVFTPALNFNGTTSFTYTIVDTGALTDTATVHVTVGASDDPPVAVDDTATVDEDSVDNIIDVLANDFDVEGDDITIVSAGGATISADAKSLLYTPPADFSGETEINYTIQSGGNPFTRVAFVTITVEPSNDEPSAVDDDEFVTFNTALVFDPTLNDTDPDGDDLTITAVGDPEHGVALLDGDMIDYRPAANFFGTDTLTYTIADPDGLTSQATVTLTVLEGLSTLCGFNEIVTVYLHLGHTPTDDDDVILGTVGDDAIDALDGDDIICALSGDDTIRGGDGDDVIFSGEGADIAFGDDGDDVLIALEGVHVSGLVGGPFQLVPLTPNGRGGAGPIVQNVPAADLGVPLQPPAWYVCLPQVAAHTNTSASNSQVIDQLNGGKGHDTLCGTRGTDELNGDNGNDAIFGDSGDDQLNGGNGVDTIDGGSGDDEISGGNSGDTIVGGSGDDTIDGGGGNDTIDGGNGHDVISGGTKDDTIEGGKGDDQIQGNRGDDIITGGSGRDIISGDVGDDDIRGGKNPDTIDGNSGADIISGDGGDDIIRGGSENDELRGGSGADELRGNAGDDSLNGSSGNDTCIGNSGVDTAKFCEITSSVP